MTPRVPRAAGSQTWVVEHPTRLAEVVSRLAPGEPSCISEGRVFVDRQRLCDTDYVVAAGSVVTWHRKRDAGNTEGTEGTATIEVLGEREGILVVTKPPSMPSEPDESGSHSLREALSQQRGGAVHVVTRLDVGVSGLVVLATDAVSRHHLQTLAGTPALHREYLAIASGELPPQGRWEGSVDTRQGRPRPAVTNFVCLARQRSLCSTAGDSGHSPLWASLLSLRPTTGRRHQLRVHASQAKSPLFGDRRYGGPHELVTPSAAVRSVPRVMLHARRLAIPCPSGRLWEVESRAPEDMAALWSVLGGDEGALR